MPSASTARFIAEPEPEGALEQEVKRINALTPKDYRNILGFVIGEEVTHESAKSKYRHLMLLLNPDKRTEASDEQAGGHEACEQAMSAVQEAMEAIGRDTREHSTREHSHPVPATRPKPPPPPGIKHCRHFGHGPLDPLPAPHPNFGVLHIMVVD